MALLSREAILQAQDRSYKDVNCPEWGGKVRVQSLSGKERDAFEESIMGQKDKDGNREIVTQNLRAKLVALTVVDQDGKHLFTQEDIAILGEKNGAVIDRLFTVAQKLSGIGQRDLDDMVKNSIAGQGAGSTSASPEN